MQTIFGKVISSGFLSVMLQSFYEETLKNLILGMLSNIMAIPWGIFSKDVLGQCSMNFPSTQICFDAIFTFLENKDGICVHKFFQEWDCVSHILMLTNLEITFEEINILFDF